MEYSNLIYILAVWSLVWKGIALWHSARKEQKIWYLAILILNTVGVLEIVYLLFFKNKERKEISKNGTEEK